MDELLVVLTIINASEVVMVFQAWKRNLYKLNLTKESQQMVYMTDEQHRFFYRRRLIQLFKALYFWD